jgi:hypothetical protein
MTSGAGGRWGQGGSTVENFGTISQKDIEQEAAKEAEKTTGTPGVALLSPLCPVQNVFSKFVARSVLDRINKINRILSPSLRIVIRMILSMLARFCFKSEKWRRVRRPRPTRWRVNEGWGWGGGVPAPPFLDLKQHLQVFLPTA